MRKLNVLFAALFMLLSTQLVNAQDDADYLTDENLRRYAILSETIDVMKSEIKVVMLSMVEQQEGIDVKRYMEIKKGEGEAASEFEQKFMDSIEQMSNDRIEDIKTVNQILATKMLPDGGKAFKAIKAAIDTDAEVKARYEAILAKIKAEDTDA